MKVGPKDRRPMNTHNLQYGRRELDSELVYQQHQCTLQFRTSLTRAIIRVILQPLKTCISIFKAVNCAAEVVM